MIKQAFIRANIPFGTTIESVFCHKFFENASASGWTKQELQGDFLLKHINTTFANNVVCFSKKCENLNVSIPIENPKDHSATYLYALPISEVQVYLFDTGIGFCSFHFPYDSDTDEYIMADCCATLHCSVLHSNRIHGKPVVYKDGETYLSCLANQFLDELLGETYCLFHTSSDTSLRRINMFSVVLCDTCKSDSDKKTYEDLCYRLANAYDTRGGKLPSRGWDFFHQQDYIRWNFSNRGCAVVANLTGVEENDNFLKDRWFFSAKSNHFYIYLMVLHQKTAIYHYLDSIAEDPDKSQLHFTQKELLDFNSKYIFSIVSDEQNVQTVYLRLKETTNVDELHTELLEQLKYMFDYAQVETDKASEAENHKLTLISTVVSTVCSVSIIFDSISLFTEHGYTFGFHSTGSILFTGVIVLEIILFLLILILLVKKKKLKIKQNKKNRKSK